MIEQTINKELWFNMIESGANHLAKHRDAINKLNVFPVPDGDTGTNMNLSMTSGFSEMKKYAEQSLVDQINGFTKGLLMGARGNSGVILSQLFRGFSAISLDKDELHIRDFTSALQKGVEIAYQSVTNPVEGTILTVAKDMAKEAQNQADQAESFIQFMELVVREARQSLERTPSLLPVLQEVGVVDSGGKGLLVIYEGFLAALKGEQIEIESAQDFEALIEHKHEETVQSFVDLESIEFGYCTEFFVQFSEEKLVEHPFDESSFRKELSAYGDSLLVASDEAFVKVHIHTEVPGEVLSLAQKYGDLTRIDIENMREQYKAIVHEEKDQPLAVKQERKYAIITVAQGDGLKEMFYSIGATEIIDGGQTMNPSTEDFLSKIEQEKAEHIFILPNNKNILLTAKQAAQLTEQAVTVIPSVTIPQGIQALFAYDELAEVGENVDGMNQAIHEVKTGLITYATRDTKINDLEVKKNDYIGLNDETIVVTHENEIEAAKQLVATMLSEEDEIITIFSGEAASEARAGALLESIEQAYPDLEVEHHRGQQPIYSYMFMIE